ncbi:MAG: hypothetical protein R3F16_10605 [Myxococcota bacterium]
MALRRQRRRVPAALLALAALGGVAWACATRLPADDWRAAQAGSSAWGPPPAATRFDPSTPPGPAAAAAAALEGVYRERVVFARPGIELAQVALAPGGLRPTRATAAPEVHLVVAGQAEWTVDGETRRVGPGTTIHHAVLSEHRFVTVSRGPLLALRARWAPEGERAVLLEARRRRRGGSLTAAFFEGEARSRFVSPIEMRVPMPKSARRGDFAAMRTALVEAREWEPARPVVRAFVESLGVPWESAAPGVRARVIFTHPDFEWGELVVEPGDEARSIFGGDGPGLVHVLDGRARLSLAHGFALEARAGTTLAVEAGEVVRVGARRKRDPEAPMRAVWARWAPGGNADYLSRGDFLLEPAGEAKEATSLDPGLRFAPADRVSGD